MPIPAPTDLTGSLLAGRYRILRKLGEGAMGTVYLGEHTKIGRQDAIKVLRDVHAGDAEAIARFNRGARNVAAIRHPNVCTIYDYSDTGDGAQFVAMQFIPGESLKELLDREGALPLERAVRIAKQTAEALQAAHEAGIVHRDLKPANIMISPDRHGDDLVTVVDFDIAKGSKEGEESEVTRLGFVVGTPEYMSPEQLTGDRLDGRSDIYSLGLVLFRMIAGSLPFVGATAQELMIKRLTEEPLRLGALVDLSGLDPQTGTGLQALFDRALARRAEDRHEDAAEFARQLLTAFGVAPEAPPGGTGTAWGPLSYSGRPSLAGTGEYGARTSVSTGVGGSGGLPTQAATARIEESIPETRVAPPIVAGTGTTGPAASVGGGRNRLLLAGGGLGALALIVLAALALREPSAGGAPVGPSAAATAEPAVPASDPSATGTAPSANPDAAASGTGTDGNLTANPPPPAGSGSASGGSTTANPSAGQTTVQPPASPLSSTLTAPPTGLSIDIDDAADLLIRLNERFALDPTRPTLAAMRDTAEMMWFADAIPSGIRAGAAGLAATASWELEDRGECARWGERSLSIRPSAEISRLLSECRQ